MTGPSDGSGLGGHFDAVVMLTWSNWHTEPRSNRYHYASRFARQLPVVFVQPDLDRPGYSFEPTQLPRVDILHLYAAYLPVQRRLLARALLERRVIRPLLWVYNYQFHDVVAESLAPLKAYHATEDYFSQDFTARPPLAMLRRVLEQTDLLVAVSDGVLEDYRALGGFAGRAVVATNGCDFAFWSEGAPASPPARPRVAVYQGGINDRLDFPLIEDVAKTMPDWEFRFCGSSVYDSADRSEPEAWTRLRSLENVRYLGELKPDELRAELHRASVGLVPYVRNDMIARSFPLKAFEYVACGLPVVSVPIRALLPHTEVFRFAETADDFVEQIRRAEPTRSDPRELHKRTLAARAHDYDARFAAVASAIRSALDAPAPSTDARYNVLVLYDGNSIHVSTIREHLDSFSLYSRNSYRYAHCTGGAADCAVDLSTFDAILIHYSVRLSLRDHLSPGYARLLRGFAGLKMLFIQDEYDSPRIACDWIESLGIQLVMTCIPAAFVDRVYPSSRFPLVRFEQTLTGYVPERLKRLPFALPLSQRDEVFGYRGRRLPFWYGRMGQDKYTIGVEVKRRCEERGVRVDIECDDAKRVYGDDWYRFLGRCRATLGTESGANLFDWDGSLQTRIREALAREPDLTFEDVEARFFPGRDGEILMNQISPKIFEAAALRTALVLFEGSYSGVLQAGSHYIPLRRDYSNFDEVLAQVSDDEFVARLTERTYEDVVASNRWSYRAFVRHVDDLLASELRAGGQQELVSIVVARRKGSGFEYVFDAFGGPKGWPQDVCTPAPLLLHDVSFESLYPFLRGPLKSAAWGLAFSARILSALLRSHLAHLGRRFIPPFLRLGGRALVQQARVLSSAVHRRPRGRPA